MLQYCSACDPFIMLTRPPTASEEAPAYIALMLYVGVGLCRQQRPYHVNAGPVTGASAGEGILCAAGPWWVMRLAWPWPSAMIRRREPTAGRVGARADVRGGVARPSDTQLGRPFCFIECSSA